VKRARRWDLQKELLRYSRRRQQPFMRDGRLTSAEERYAEGDNTVIMPELTWRLLTGKVSAVRAADAGDADVIPISIPTWLWRALFRANIRATCMEIDSWDEVFGAPCLTSDRRPARGKTRLAMRRKAELQFDIYKRVKALEAQGKAVDRALFACIAKDFGIGRTMAEKIYYDHRAMVELIESSRIP
jgi:hypothetical protein